MPTTSGGLEGQALSELRQSVVGELVVKGRLDV
jgi:hypothetical protein